MHQLRGRGAGHAALLFAVALAAVTLRAQTPAPATASQISPQAAYDEALRPVDITHRSVENWSEIETAALAVAIRQAKESCNARQPVRFAGDDLIALARLCALGQQWPSVLEAASRYIGQPNTPQPQLAQAYTDQIEAALHLNEQDTALSASRAMLGRVSYGALTQQATSETARYLQLVRTRDAIALLELRQPRLLACLHEPAPGAADLSVHALYAEGLTLAALQQFVNSPVDAAATVHTLDSALPSTLTPDDALPIAASRRQYALLGRPLPPIAAAVSLFSPTETPRISTEFGSSTVLVLFPDWCAQCVRMGQQFVPTLFRLAERDVHLYGLLAQATPPSTAAPAAQHAHTSRTARSAANSSQGARTSAQDSASTSTKSPADLLRGTPTLIVSPHVLDDFGATDFPLLVMTDRRGVLRFLQVAPENAFAAGGLVDQVTSRIAAEWPSPAHTPALPATR